MFEGYGLFMAGAFVPTPAILSVLAQLKHHLYLIGYVEYREYAYDDSGEDRRTAE